MAIIKCDECGAKISSKAVACPQCGNPTGDITETLGTPLSIVEASSGRGFNYLLWIGLPIALVVAFIVIGTVSYQVHGGDTAYRKDRLEECSKAIMSSMGTNTNGYQDKQAYDAHVAEKCDGLTPRK